jgi:transposase-like protein
MTPQAPPQAPPFCPNPKCRYHCGDRRLWHWVRAGFYRRKHLPGRIQRYRCDTCRRYFSDQTFRTTYWLKRPGLWDQLPGRLVSCSGFRQIARETGVSPQTVLRQSARLGRHSLLYHERHRPRGAIGEPVALDSFQSFEYSQDHPTLFHVVAGRTSHFVYGLTDSELRRSGRMTRRQRARRARIEAALGRPDPRSIEREVEALLRITIPPGARLELHSDEHAAYPRALRRLADRTFEHHTISSRAARTPRNPLFAINLLDLLVRHCGANHKRETIAFSKRRQSAVERLAAFIVWRNWIKAFSERRQDASPAMRLGLIDRRLTWREILHERLFPTRLRLPRRWQDYYERRIPTRRIPNGARHDKVYAF